MAIGIILGHFVPSAGPVLQKGQFVGVSLPLGILLGLLCCLFNTNVLFQSHWPPCHDVSYSLQSTLRDASSSS